ncbi:MAG: hypothetical protein KAW47_04430 [Thermoplasmatales archaeon]|nr:hypothetical protein [Thermoplasmatales archaeon]
MTRKININGISMCGKQGGLPIYEPNGIYNDHKQRKSRLRGNAQPDMMEE